MKGKKKNEELFPEWKPECYRELSFGETWPGTHLISVSVQGELHVKFHFPSSFNNVKLLSMYV